MAVTPVTLGRAYGPYSFYPPLSATPSITSASCSRWRHRGSGRVDVHQNLRVWTHALPGRPVPLPMFATSAGPPIPRAWTAVGAPLEFFVAAHSRRAWPCFDDQCWARARVLLVDAARDCLFLADTDLYRLLHDPTSGDRRQDLQRYDDAARLHRILGRRNAYRHPSHVRRPGGRRWLQIHPLDIHCAGRNSDPDDGLHHLRFGRDRRAASRRAGPVRLARGAAVEQPDHARFSPFLRDAGFRRRRRAHQHELPAQRDHPQYTVGHRTFSPHLRRRDRDHVFCHRL